MAFYPDNVHRLQRVQDLVNNIGSIQETMQAKLRWQKLSNGRTVETLAKIAKSKGYPTVDDYVDSVLKLLPEDQRKRLIELRAKFTDQHEDLKLAFNISMYFMGVAMAPDAIAFVGPKIVKIVQSLTQYIQGMFISAEAVSANLAAAAAAGTSEAGAAEKAAAELGEVVEKASENLARSSAELGELGEVGAGVLEEISAGARFLRFAQLAGRIATVLAVLAVIGTLVADAVIGAQQRAKLQAYTQEYTSKRFAAARLNEQFGVAFSFFDDAKAIVMLEDKLSQYLTPEQVAKAVAAEAKKTGEKYAPAMDGIQDSTIFGNLQQQDKVSGTWTNEDPTLPQMKAWLEEHKNDKST